MRNLVRATWLGVLTAIVFLGTAGGSAVAWEPTKPVEFIAPAGVGGGADVMSRWIAAFLAKEKMAPQPFVVVNKAGGAGAEGFTYVKGKQGDPHTILITLSSLFTTPLAVGIPFNWRDLTPVARLALDEFVLWVHEETPYRSAGEYLKAVKAKPGEFKMAGTGTAQEDQIITIQLEQAAGVKFTYVPFKGGGEVCKNLAGKHVDSTVNNPAECVGLWKGGKVRPLGVFDTERMVYPDWKDIPTMREAGYNVNYLMLRGIFTTPGVSKEVQDYYVGLFNRVTETAEWKKYIEDNGLKAAFLTGAEYVKWLGEAENLHKDLMKKGGLIK
ncbi:MAG: tripartite tricarboxylate transporter substrate binding protein [candidate division NC10 bacterium]|nr:tripartite tricarboxylate transporter substrate binding protein [candidate division NC10 bacterium]